MNFPKSVNSKTSFLGWGKILKIFQLIVSYNPEFGKLKANINSIAKQLDKIVIVDNGSKNISKIDTLTSIFNHVEIIRLHDNMGIAFATNIGIKEAQKQGCDYLLLSDQDTVYPCNYVKYALKIITSENKIFAVTPLIFDKITNTYKLIYVKKGGFIRKAKLKGRISVFQTIASGLFVNIKLIDNTLLQNDDLFIDYVDFEWCWNALKHGYKIIADEELKINHALGDKIGTISGRKISLRSENRYYYLVRNTIYLACYSNYLSFCLKMQLAFKSFEYLIGYSILSKHSKGKVFILLNKALIDGMSKRLGKKL